MESLRYPVQETGENVDVGDLSPLEEEIVGTSNPNSSLDTASCSSPPNGDNIKESSEGGEDMKTKNRRKATIMVAGRARNGKSTALNNVFGLKLTAKASAKSVTQVVSVSEVTKKVRKPKVEGDEVDQDKEEEEEVTLRVIDTPGLGATDIKKETILSDMKKITEGEDYTLMYCFSVAPNTIILETDKAIVENLQQSLGKKVWSKCVLLFTFSDYAYDEFEDSQEDYIEHIKSHAKEFQELLNSIEGNQTVGIKTIFEYQSPEKLDLEETPSDIIAIPVNKKPKNSKKILPGMIKEGQDWTDIVFIELMKKTGEEERAPFIFFRYPNLSLLGAGTGAAVGVLGGPVGMAAGAALGAAIGAVAEFTIKGVISFVSHIKKMTI